MKIENQVCSLKLAKKLKELGVEQLGLFSWYKVKERFGDGIKIEVINNMYADDVCGDGVEVVCSAFSVAELGEILPKNFVQQRDHWNKFLVWLIENDGKEIRPETRAKSEANARAKMLVYLLENKLIKLKEKK